MDDILGVFNGGVWKPAARAIGSPTPLQPTGGAAGIAPSPLSGVSGGFLERGRLQRGLVFFKRGGN